MRPLATLTLAVVLALGSAGSSTSQVLDNPAVKRCDAGLQRSINACGNMHDIGSGSWHQCLDYSLSMHKMCVMEAVDHMDTVGD